MAITPNAYHERTKHMPGQYARSLGYMDWDTQPDPFRVFVEAPRVRLGRLPPSAAQPTLDQVYSASVPPPTPALSRAVISQLLFDSLALSAWKQAGSARWSLRCNPSSGNLHPTEGYIVAPAIDGIGERPAVYHYCSLDHALERRRELDDAQWGALTQGLPADALLVGLTAIYWRESWKYGERAFRYCQHDAGHAIAAVALAASTLGFETRLLTNVGDADIERLLGVNDQRGMEAEHADALLALVPRGSEIAADTWSIDQDLLDRLEPVVGERNELSDSHHGWPVIDEVSEACRKPRGGGIPHVAHAVDALPDRNVPSRTVFRQRRSAVDLDGETSMSREQFFALLARCRPGRAPFTTLPWRARVHPVLCVHRVDDFPTGVFLFVRDAGETDRLRTATRSERLSWTRDETWPDGLVQLFDGDVRDFAELVNCGQSIGGAGAFSVGMLADFDGPIAEHGPWFYRALHWEAGMLGQVLYLEAEAAGLRGTGIGCFFDDIQHGMLGLADTTFQTIYHFTIGKPIDDPRLQTLDAYAHLE